MSDLEGPHSEMPFFKTLRRFSATLALCTWATSGALAEDSSQAQSAGAEGSAGGLIAAVAPAETAQAGAAIAIAEQIWRGPYSGAERLRAALVIADYHASNGRFLISKFWARRAYALGASPQERQAIAALYKRIEAASPISASARLSFAPSSNVNNGGETKIIVIGGFPFVFGDSSLRLSGIEATGGAALSYKINQTSRSLTEAYGDVSFRSVWLEPRAVEVAPELSSADFDQLGLSIGLRHTWQALANLGPTIVALSFGSAHQAGDQTTDWRMLEARQVLMQSRDLALRMDLQLRSDDRLGSSISSSVTRRIGGLYQVRLDGLELAAQIGVTDVNSGSALVEKDEVAAGISVSGIGYGPFGLAISVDVAYADFPKWVLTSGGRQDTSFGARIEATYGAISVLGFSPSLTLSARQTDSNLDIFDRSQTSLGLSFRSNF